MTPVWQETTSDTWRHIDGACVQKRGDELWNWFPGPHGFGYCYDPKDTRAEAMATALGQVALPPSAAEPAAKVRCARKTCRHLATSHSGAGRCYACGCTIMLEVYPLRPADEAMSAALGVTHGSAALNEPGMDVETAADVDQSMRQSMLGRDDGEPWPVAELAELRATIVGLEAEIATLKTRNNRLHERNADLEARIAEQDALLAAQVEARAEHDLGRRYDVLQAECESMRGRLECMKEQLEDKRADRWHATYNAALCGALSHLNRGDIWEAGGNAQALADAAHNPLKETDDGHL